MTLDLKGHIYWKHKREFQLAEDIYPHWCMFLPEEGRFKYGIEQQFGDAGFGNLILSPPGSVFYREIIQPLSFHFLLFTWEGPASYLPIGNISFKDTDRLTSTLRHLKDLEQTEDVEASLWKNHLLHDLFKLYHMESSVKVVSLSIHPPDETMLLAAEHLRLHAHEQLSLKALADQLRLSPVQLTRRFQAAFHQTPSEFLTKERISQAARYLTETTKTLDVIARECGYENGFYLSRVFTKKMKMSPSEYRRTHRI